jgi:hypothetical protein
MAGQQGRAPGNNRILAIGIGLGAALLALVLLVGAAVWWAATRTASHGSGDKSAPTAQVVDLTEPQFAHLATIAARDPKKTVGQDRSSFGQGSPTVPCKDLSETAKKHLLKQFSYGSSIGTISAPYQLFASYYHFESGEYTRATVPAWENCLKGIADFYSLRMGTGAVGVESGVSLGATWQSIHLAVPDQPEADILVAEFGNVFAYWTDRPVWNDGEGNIGYNVRTNRAQILAAFTEDYRMALS